MNFRDLSCFLLAVSVTTDSTRAEIVVETAAVAETTAAQSPPISPAMRAAVEKLSLPGVKINLDQWCVDVASRVCLGEGLLELIACTEDTKEHESLIMVEAKPSHIHTALLLLGAKSGSPASQQAINPEMTRFRHNPPSGDPVEVFLVFKDPTGAETERPISDFIERAEGHDTHGDEAGPEEVAEKFPAHTLLFAGSVIVAEGDGPHRYLSDSSGSVISLATFGDELLCLPGFHESSNEALAWQIATAHLPKLGSKLILRLRPQASP
ncbi:MAG: YdjY domain-containing protein [Akkermansiaceae bacterium]